MIEGIVGFALAIMIAAGSAGAPSDLGLAGPAVAAAWVAVLFLLERLWIRALTARVVALRRIGAAVRPGGLWSLVALRTLAFAALCSVGWATPLLGNLPPLLGAPLLLLPWLLLHALALAPRRSLHVATQGRDWPLGDWLAFHLRTLLIPALFTGPLVLVLALLETSEPTALWIGLRPSLGSLIALGTMLALAALAPLIVRAGLRTTSLPAGSLRSELEELSESQGFRPLDIRVIDTNDNVLNAAFVGFLGRLRYVFLTDALLRRFDPGSLVAVYAHEMGHSVKRHILFYLALVVGLSATTTVAAALLVLLGAPVWLAEILLPLGLLVLFFRLVVPRISRRFETEADVYAAQVLGRPEPISAALGELGRIYPHRRRRGGMLHPGLDQRRAFLAHWWADEELRGDFREGGFRLRLGILAFLGLALLALAALLPSELRRASLLESVQEASDADDEALALRAHERLDEALKAGMRDPDFNLRFRLWQIISTDRQDRADYEGAAPWVERLVRHAEEVEDPARRYTAAVIRTQQAGALGNWPEFLRRLREAERLLPEVEKVLGRDHEGLEQERVDLVFLGLARRLFGHLGAYGVIAPGGAPPELPEGPPYDQARALWELRDGPFPASDGPLAGPELDALPELWKRDFLRSLLRFLRGRSGG